MEISVLGSMSVRRDGSVVDPGPRVRRLLAALAVRHGDVASVDHLVDVVWMGEPPSGAEKTLKSYVTRLRSIIDPERDGLITFQDPGYVLSLPKGALDSEQFDAELNEAHHLLRAGDDESALLLLDRGLQRWHGPAYAGVADEEWARPTAVRLEERRLDALETRLEIQLASDDAEQAVADAKALVEAEPLRERPRALLMRAHYTAGRQAEALRVFRDYRTMLIDEVGLDPSDDLAGLEARIARRDSSLSGTVRALRGYELGERIGEGAFAIVRRAVQPGVGRDVAIKIIRAELADQPDFVRRFEHEAQIIATVEHPNVVPLYDFWREPGAAYLVMRLMRGGSVEQALRSRGPYSRQDMVALLRDIGGALTAAHRAGVIHRDVRPANLLLDEDGTTYLADFGIALPAQHSGTQDVAAPAYAAPELLRNEPGGVTSDVLSLAVTVFELLTGRLPFAETTERAELVRRQLDEPLPSVRATRTDLPASIDDVLARATAKAAGDRHPTIDAFVNDVIAALDVDDSRSVTPALAGSAEEVASNPYIGIHAFDETDADRFFGRESLVVELVELVEREPLVVVVGPSGSGKSSAVRAGLLPALRRGAVPGSDSWFIASMLPGADPIAALETSLLRIAVNPPSSLREQLAEDGGLLRAIRRVLPDDTSRILLVVDQFEELFTQTDSTDEQQRFLTELAAAIAAPDSPLRVVATLRADHYDAPLRHPGMAELVTAGTVTVRPMVPGEIERAVVLPARHVGVDVEPALVAELVAGVTQRPATLPLLQFALTEVFERRVARVMLHSTYESIGGLTGALAARADRIIGSDGSDEEREARRIFSRLVTTGPGATSDGVDTTGLNGDLRRRAHRSEFGDGERTAWLLDAFVSARLLTVDRDPATREPTVEVAHEALLRDWPRLRNWLDEDRDDLATLHGVRTSAAAWEASGFDDGELARSTRLQSATELVSRRPDFLNDAEKAWVDASTEREEAERLAELEAIERDHRQNRNLRRLLIAAAILLVVSLGAAGGAFVLRNRAVASEQSAERSTAAALKNEALAVEAQGQAQDERATAEAAQETADSERTIALAARENAEIERLSAVSAQQISSSPDRAILLALEANRRRDDISTQTAVHRAIGTEPRRLAVFPSRLEGNFNTLFSRDGEVGIVWSDDRLEFFDPVTGERLGVLYEPGARITTLQLSGDGSVAGIGLADETIEVVDHDGEAVQVSTADGFATKWLSMDLTGSRIVVTTEETTALVIDVATSREIGRYAPNAFPGTAFSTMENDGNSFNIVYQVGERQSDGQFGDYVTAEGVLLDSGMSDVRAVTANSSGDGLIVTGAEGGGLAVWAAGDFENTTKFSGGSADQVRVAVSNDLVVSAGTDGMVRFWTLGGQAIGSPVAIGGDVTALGPRSDGTVAVAVRGQGHQIISVTEPLTMLGRYPTDGYSQIIGGADRFEVAIPGVPESQIRALVDGAQVGSVDQTAVAPDGNFGEPFFSSDGNSLFSYGDLSAGVSAVSSDGQWALDTNTTYEQVFGSLPSELVVYAIRPEHTGERTFIMFSDPESGWAAIWVDTPTGEIIAGPLFLDERGPPLTLSDGRVVVAGTTILPADLVGFGTPVPDADGMAPIHESVETGVVLMISEDGAVGFLDLDSATIRYAESGPGGLYAGGISPDGRLAAVASSISGVQVYDVETGQRLGVPMKIEVEGQQARRGGLDKAVGRGLRWSADGLGVWVAPPGGPVEFSASVDTWRKLACGVVNRELTAEEWRTFVSETDPQVAACP